MKAKITLITMSAGMALLAATAVASPLLRCTGSDGRVVYSDRKCASGERREIIKITDNSMDNSKLQNAVAIRSGMDSAASSQGGGSVAVIGNNSRSASSASSSSRPARRRCGG